MRYHSWAKDILHHERCKSFNLYSQTLTLHLTCNKHRNRQGATKNVDGTRQAVNAVDAIGVRTTTFRDVWPSSIL